MRPIQFIALLIVAVVGIFAANSIFVVSEVEKALVLSLGKVDREISKPGLHFRRPFIQQLVKYDDRVLDLDLTSEEVVTKDKKRIVVDSFVRWRIANAKEFYETQRTESNARSQLAVIVSSAAKRALARQDMQDIISGERAAVMRDILHEARRESQRLGVEVVDVRIRRADLPQENSQAIYNRMRAERSKEAKEIRAKGEEEAQKIRSNAERERTILLAEADRKAQVLRGEGDAESIRIYADAFGRDPEFYAFSRNLEAYRNALARPDATLIVDPGVSFMDVFEGKKHP